MVTTGTTGITTFRNMASGMLQSSLNETPQAGGDTAADEIGTEPVTEEDCYIPSAQRLAEESLQSCVAAQPVPRKDDKKSLGEELVNTIIDFFKGPANIYLHKKSTDAAVEGDFERSGKIEEVKADYNKRYPVPEGRKPVKR